MWCFFDGEGRLFYGVKLRRVQLLEYREQRTDNGQRSTDNGQRTTVPIRMVVCCLLTVDFVYQRDYMDYTVF